MTRVRFVAPAFAALLVAAAVPALADHNQSEPGHEHPAQEAATHDSESAADTNAFPTNDLSTSMGSKVSSPAISSGSLHASPKIMNNAGLANDLKTALEPAKPAVLDEKPASLEPAPAPVLPPAAVQPEIGAAGTINLQIAPRDAASPPAAGPAGDAPAARTSVAWLLPVIGLGLLAAGAGFFISRLMRGQGGSPS